MKLATLHDGTRDGTLVIVSRDLARAVAVPEIARTMQRALDRWDSVGVHPQGRVCARRTEVRQMR